jgi:hypothetical protein
MQVILNVLSKRGAADSAAQGQANVGKRGKKSGKKISAGPRRTVETDVAARESAAARGDGGGP